jgi:L-lysine exporter family protein LysE/ArgO
MQTYLTGFTIGIGLIVAIGAQNAWVLSMSVRRIHPWTVAVVCFTLDSLLMAIGVLTFSKVQELLPSVVPWLTGVGILMLLWLAIQAATRAFKGEQSLDLDEAVTQISRSKAIATALALSLINPHVYLDTVVLIGSVGSSSDAPWLFWAGAASSSVFWFSSLALVGQPLRRWLSSSRRWRVFDGSMALLMAWVAFSLYSTI